ncbi:MAG: zinc transporter ZupT [Desulfonatronovibrionaceae bacterium]
MDVNNVLLAFSLTLLAGLSTGIGSALAFFVRRTNPKMLSLALGFSAGVMIYVSFAEILVKARGSLQAGLGEVAGAWWTTAAFFTGMAVIGMIDKLVPSSENPHEAHRIEYLGREEQKEEYAGLYRTGVFTALAIAIHNFPEGLATFAANLQDPALGFPIAVAIALHNIPEGIAVSVPLYYATGSRKKAFFLSFLSGLAEPAGALIGFLLLMPFLSPVTFGALFAGVAGIMVFISLDELLPSAEEYGEHHLAIIGVVAGMAVMAGSLLSFM